MGAPVFMKKELERKKDLFNELKPKLLEKYSELE